MTAQRLVPASNPLAQPVQPHFHPAGPGLYEAKSFPQCVEEEGKKERGKRQADQEQKNYSVCFGHAGADSEKAPRRGNQSHMAAECAASLLAARLQRTSRLDVSAAAAAACT